MSESIRRRFCVAVVALAVAALTIAEATAQTRDHVSLAQDLMRAAFPELSGDLAVVLNSKMGDEWRLAGLTTVAVRRFDPTASNHSRVVLSAFIHATNGLLSEASFFGEYVGADLAPVFKSAQKKGGDVAANVVSELRKRGAKYLPSATDEFLSALNLKGFSDLLGPLQEARARFSAVPPFEVASFDEWWPSWVVDMKTSLPSGGNRCYYLLVDPLSLRVTRISNTECKTSGL